MKVLFDENSYWWYALVMGLCAVLGMTVLACA